jgi:hypothetical protein
MQSVTLRSGRMKSALTIWLIWLDLLVQFGVAASRSTCVSLRITSVHIDLQREEDLVPLYSSSRRGDGSCGLEVARLCGRLILLSRTTFNPTAEHDLPETASAYLSCSTLDSLHVLQAHAFGLKGRALAKGLAGKFRRVPRFWGCGTVKSPRTIALGGLWDTVKGALTLLSARYQQQYLAF